MTSQPGVDILARDVSLFAGSTHNAPIDMLPLAAVLQRIQGGTYRTAVMSLRRLLARGDHTRYRVEKAKSLAFTPCCALRTRARERPWSQKLLSTTGLVHFDLDHLEDTDAVKRQLAQDAHVAFAFVSPSGQGLKIGVAARGITGPEDYKHAWTVVLDALKRTYPVVHFNEDPQVKYLHALCYVSDDPHLYVNSQAVPYIVPPPTPRPSPQPRRMDATPGYARVADALACIANHDADYETWLTLGMALHSTGAFWARELWDSWSRQSEKFDARKQATSWASFTRDGHVTIASLFHLAKQHGDVPPPQAIPHPGARNGPGVSASGSAQPHDTTGHGQASTPQAGPLACDAMDVARQTVDLVMQHLGALPEEAREDAVLESLATLAPLDMLTWMRLKKRLKAAVPALNLHDLERARQELRRTATRQTPPSWPLPGPDRRRQGVFCQSSQPSRDAVGSGGGPCHFRGVGQASCHGRARCF